MFPLLPLITLRPQESRINFNGETYPTTVIRYWSGEGRSATDGTWRVDYSQAGFKKVFTVTATPNTTATGLANVPIVAVMSFGPAEARGYVLNNNTGGILLGGAYSGLKMSNVATAVSVFVVGV